MLTSLWNAEKWHKRVPFSAFSAFFIVNLLLYGSKILISDVGLHSLHAHDIKCNVSRLTPNQITFCLGDTIKHYF